jgi:hypothetical protein
LIDENVDATREDSYRTAGVMIKHASYHEWNKSHYQSYLTRFVHLSQPERIPFRVNRQNSEECPETFKPDSALREFGGASPELELVRIESVQRIADRIELISRSDILDAAKTFLLDPDSSSGHGRLQGILNSWNRKRDLRPLWAGFWDEMKDLFGETPDQDAAGWADELRNRLGLYHINPPERYTSEIEIFVFRYPVRIVPILEDRREFRALAIPTALDYRLNEAFFPAPQAHSVGYSVYLGTKQPYRSYKEIVHFHVAFTPEHLFRVGTIKQPAEPDLSPVRKQHLEWLRNHTGRIDYGKVGV